jgi:hypothetical protein
LAREKVVDWLKASGIDYTVFRPTGYFNDITLVYDKVATKGVCNKTGRWFREQLEKQLAVSALQLTAK